MKFMRFGLVLGFLLAPTLAFAATGFLGQIVPACTEGGDGICQACNLVQLAENILRTMVTLSVFAASLMFAYAGFLYVTAASNHNNIESAKKIFANTLIGLVFILAAYLIVDLSLKVLTGESLDVRTRIQCVQGTRSTGPLVQFTPVPDAAPVTGAQGGTGDGTAGYCQNGDWGTYNTYTRQAVAQYAPNLLNGTPTGIDAYCPNYATMSRDQRLGFWERYFASISNFESGCKSNPTPFPEPQNGIDAVTGTTEVSEGLYQLSYGSARGYAQNAPAGVCQFNYAARDITDPQKNTNCAVYTLSTLVQRKGGLDSGANAYWSVTRPGSHRSDIIASTRTVAGCQ